MPRELLEPILEGGTKFINFFEGRILTGQDLRDEQEAARHQRRLLGRAAGAGVVTGLDVTVDNKGSAGEKPVLAVAPGLAITPSGDALELRQVEKIALARAKAAVNGTPSVFKPCQDRPPGVDIAAGAGIYLLVMSGASGFQQQAPKSGLQEAGTAGECGSRYATAGVQFRLEQLFPATFSDASAATRTLLQTTLLGATDPAKVSLLRNILAHLCFGTERAVSFARDPFAVEAGQSAFAAYGGLDDLRANGTITGCDMPLALFYWTANGIEFLDRWSVRRRMHRTAPSEAWPLVGAQRRRAEAEAAVFQFHDHLSELLSAVPNPSLVRADQYFRYLPAAGILPLAEGGTAGFHYPAFFGGLTTRGPLFIEGARLLPLFDAALSYDPIELTPSAVEGKKVIWLYYPRENRQAAAGTAPPSRRYLVFARGHVPYMGDPRYDRAHWNFSNYALV